MVKRRDNPRLRRALILALFLLVPVLLSDLPLFSKTGHRPAPGGAATAARSAGTGGTSEPAPPLEAAALRPGAVHWHTAAGADGEDMGGQGDALLQNLVYLTHGEGRGDANAPLRDGVGGDDGSDHGSGGGGGFGPGGNDPGTDVLPLAFAPPGPDGGKDEKDDKGGKGGPPAFLPPAIPSIAAVPEPATWALFILGFGFTGAALRRARDRAHIPALTQSRRKRLG